MSREVRRVPVDWHHPTQPNPYWRGQQASRRLRGRPEPKLHAPDVSFAPLFADYPAAAARHANELGQISRREGHQWEWPLGYHLTGYADRDGVWQGAQPMGFYAEDGETYREVVPLDEDHLQQLLIQQKTDECPDPAAYLPVFDVPEDELGWCLYETVSEGTPVTPVFETAEQLVEHLVTNGEDWGQDPYRREAAELLVGAGSSFGSFVILGDRQVLDGARDLDRIEGVTSRG
jgi:hypothetical protein